MPSSQLEFPNQMIASNLNLGHNKFTLSSCSYLIDYCLSLNSLASAKSIHARLIKIGFHRHTFLSNRLIDLYSRLSAIASALRVFQDIPIKNTFTWNILLAAFSNIGRMEVAHHLFEEMPERDTVSWNSMISGYAANGLVERAFLVLYRMQELGVRASGFTYSIAASCVFSTRQAKQVHGSIIRNGLNSSNTVISNSLIDMYGKLGLVSYACSVFQTMEDPDSISWNSMISVFDNYGYGDQALEYFRLMRDLGFSLDEFTASTMINVCTNLQNLVKGEQALAQCFKMGYLSNSIVTSAVIDMYSKCDRLDDSVQLFQEIARWDSALCNSMISGYTRNGFVDEALRLFVVALGNDFRPTEFTFASILSSSSCFGLAEQGTQLHSWVLKLGYEADMIVASALVDMYAKLGSAESAMKIASEMSVKDLVSWNTVIMGLAQNGQGREALRIFKGLLENGPQLDRITLFGVLSACGHEGMISEGRSIFSSMEGKYGIKRGIEHYACMVDMMGRAGRLREAMDFIETMPQKPSALIWGSLLEACRIHGSLRFAEIVAERMMELEPRSLLPYNVLTRMYGTRGRWDCMARVHKAMKERGVQKVSGCSWIGIKNHVVVFKADQILHCRGEAIYSILRLLVWEMGGEGYVPEQHAVFGDG